MQEIDQAEGFENRRTCSHTWQPVSFVFERELWTLQQRAPNSPLNILDPAGAAQTRIDVIPQVRMPDDRQGRVYCVCMKCASHTYITTQFAGFQLGGDRAAAVNDPHTTDDADVADGAEPLATREVSSSQAPLRILFWEDVPGQRPQDFIRDDVSDNVRRFLTKILMDGESIAAYKGHAKCRICNAQLGSHDLSAYGFIWPQMAEHYITEHAVWTPDCALLVERAVIELEKVTP